VTSAKSRYFWVLDVGHGNCAVLRVPEATIVIDTGAKSSLLEFLDREKIKRIDVLFLTHADKDHIGGLIGLLSSKTVRIDKICLNTDSGKESAIWKDLLYELDLADNRGDLSFQPLITSDDTISLESGNLVLEVLAPSKFLAARGPGSTDSKGRRIKANSISAVIKLVLDAKPLILLPADIDDVGLDDMLEHKVDLAAPILVFPHHGGASGSAGAIAMAKRLWDLVKPKVVIFSVGRGRDKHPQPDLIKEIRTNWNKCHIACTQLTKHCAEKTPFDSAIHLAPTFSSGAEDGECCTGTFALNLNDVRSRPTFDEHQKFITENAPTALCRG
jgi:beta-lactamase superfamily II metal-dependent hydrolase